MQRERERERERKAGTRGERNELECAVEPAAAETKKPTDRF